MYYLVLQVFCLIIVALLGGLFMQLIAKAVTKHKPTYITALKTAIYIVFAQATVSIVSSFVLLDWANSIPRALVIIAAIGSVAVNLYIGALVVQRCIIDPDTGKLPIGKAFLISLGQYAGALCLALIYTLVLLMAAST